VVADQAMLRRAPIKRDRRRLAAHPAVLRIVERVEQRGVRRVPVERLVVEEMRLFLARHLQRGMEPEQRVERAGAGFLRAADDEGERHAEWISRNEATMPSTTSGRTCIPSSRKTSPVIAYS